MKTIMLGTIKKFFSEGASFQNVKCEPSQYITRHCHALQLRNVGVQGGTAATKPSLQFKLYRKLETVIMNKQNTAGTDIKYLHGGCTKRSLHFKL